jgi:hypothetical protein
MLRLVCPVYRGSYVLFIEVMWLYARQGCRRNDYYANTTGDTTITAPGLWIVVVSLYDLTQSGS